MTIQTINQNGNNVIVKEHESLSTAINIIKEQSDNMLRLTEEFFILKQRIIELETELKNRNDTIERLVRMVDTNTPKLIQTKKKDCRIIPLYKKK